MQIKIFFFFWFFSSDSYATKCTFQKEPYESQDQETKLLGYN